jgi:glycosyltransferase involved in cell wall biosynthesis
VIIPKIKLLSVVIPSRGRSFKLQALLDAIESIAVGTQTPFEVVVVIDGDGEQSKPSVSYPLQFIWSPHVGAGQARNLGIEASSGDAILFLNDDVIPSEGLFDAHVQSLNDGHDAVLGNSPWIDVPDPNGFDCMIRYTPAVFHQHGMSDGKKYNFKHAWTLNLSVRRTILDSIPAPFAVGLRPIYYEDLEFAYRGLGQAGSILYNNSACVIHDHRVGVVEYFAREVLLGIMSVVLFKTNSRCHNEIFRLTPAEHSDAASAMIATDIRDHTRLLARFNQHAMNPVDQGDPIEQAGLLYDLHLPLKRRAFRIGLLAMIEKEIPWESRVDHAQDLLRGDPVLRLLETIDLTKVSSYGQEREPPYPLK